jgi:hypothetical protein
MPQVGSKHFGYNAAGRSAAKREAARTGKPVTYAGRKPATTGKPSTPGYQRASTASARNKGQYGMAKRSPKAKGRGYGG